jgi:biopolymer transport protein ExbD
METLSSGPGRAGRTRVVLSLTPLIDVVFILLVFFMLVSQFAQWRIIDVTPVTSGDGPGIGKPPLIVTLAADGSAGVAGQHVTTVDEAVSMVRDTHADGQAVLIRPDESVAVQPVVDLVEALAVVGIQSINVEAGSRP